MAPTIVLVHGAYAESTSWEGLLGRLPTDGRVIAFANPLRGLATDTALLTDLVVFSAGVRPSDALGRVAGLEIAERGGIVTDDSCRTSDEFVWAVGEVAAVEGRCYGLVAPGYTMTKRMEGTIASGLLDESQVTRLIPLRRFALPEEIARAVYFLGSPASSYITGQTLYVDGGAVVNSHW